MRVFSNETKGRDDNISESENVDYVYVQLYLEGDNNTTI